ncbi:ornithine decarboxylase, partial [Lactobacillus iners]|nr:ornithine decarboxylase [Lactobacillus iners]
MNFLKIALSNGLKNNNFNSWQTTNLNNKPQASELAAIVLAEGDQDSLKTAQDLQKTSGLGIPIIKVSHETISNNEKEKIIDAANKYTKEMVP